MQAKGLSLLAPSGVKIASSVVELKNILNPLVYNKFNKEIKYEITKIEYLNSSKGFFAIIDFVMPSGEQSNVIYCNSFPNQINYNKSKVKYLSTAKKQEQQGYSFSCSGPTCCKVHAISHPDGTVDIDCSCDGCTMTININK